MFWRYLKDHKSYLSFLISLAVIVSVIFVFKPRTPADDQYTTIPTGSGITGGSIKTANDGSKLYTDSDYGFSFSYPSTFSAGAFSDSLGTKTILLQDESKKSGIQIYISAFGEDITLTKKRILKDAPDMEMNNDKEITIGNSAKGLMFDSMNSSGATKEIWFVYKKDLYQVSSPSGSEKLMSGIITTWQWNKAK